MNINKQIIHFEPLTPATFSTYIAIGTKAYKQHYTHLWPKKDCSTYINESFTLEVLRAEEKNNNSRLFLINQGAECVGILKFTISKELAPFSSTAALYVNKIYIVNESCGFGIGTKTLSFVSLRAKKLQKSIIWLDTMQKGPALNFYKKNGFTIHAKKEIHFATVIEAEKPMFIMIKKLD